MKIWVDADACPGAVKEIILTAAMRRAVQTVFVANKLLNLPQSSYVSFVQVNKTPDAADLYIREHALEADLVVTQDILLASELVPNRVSVINPRGSKYSQDNIADMVATRNLLEGLRDSGAITGGPKQFGERERRAFAATFDKELTKLLKM